MKYQVNDNSWSHGDPVCYLNKGWDGRPLHIYLGPCPDCGSRTFDYGGGWRCCSPFCSRSYNNPAPSVGEKPSWWDMEEMILSQQGLLSIWKAVYSNPNLHRQFGYGKTPDQAVHNLIAYYNPT